jgi:S-adenosylmethionine:tRNA ribosyltransferase-isomerase
MRVDEFDFDLPEDRIALRPARPRDSARLLVVRGPEGVLEDRVVRDLPGLLKAGDVLVANDTRVIRARLFGRRGGRVTRHGNGGEVRIEATLNQPVGPAAWSAFAKPGRRLSVGDVIAFRDGLSAKVAEKRDDGVVLLVFNDAGESLMKRIEAQGSIPLPPYIAAKREADADDDADYQTMFAREGNSVAAPTAGLHFTPELLQALAAKGVSRETVTLHVNAGTFRPVSAERTEDHQMHAELAQIGGATAARINAARAAGGRCIPVGTTALRTLESASAGGELASFSAETSIFITPGYRFRVADGLMTNFHLPKSTLFMLVCAMMGVDVMKRAYAHAVKEGYRFFSYGDACLLLPNG